MDERIMLAIAVAATVALCVAGVYATSSENAEKEDVRVIVPHGMEDDMAAFFSPFGGNARADMKISPADAAIADTDIENMLNGGADAVVAGNLDISAIDGVKKMKLSDGAYIYFKEGGTGMAGAFANWVSSQALFAIAVNAAGPGGIEYFNAAADGWEEVAGIIEVGYGSKVLIKAIPDEGYGFEIAGWTAAGGIITLEMVVSDVEIDVAFLPL